jgi:hypothetical protein
MAAKCAGCWRTRHSERNPDDRAIAQLIGVGDGLGEGDGDGLGAGDGEGAFDGLGVGDDALEGAGVGPQPGHGGVKADDPPPPAHAEIVNAAAKHNSREYVYFMCSHPEKPVFIVPLRREASRTPKFDKEQPKRA